MVTALDALVILLVVLAAIEHVWSRVGRRSPLHRRQRPALSAGGLDVFSAALAPGRSADLEEQRARAIRRDVVQDGAPPYGGIDLDAGTVSVDAVLPGNRNLGVTSLSRAVPTVGDVLDGGGER